MIKASKENFKEENEYCFSQGNIQTIERLSLLLQQIYFDIRKDGFYIKDGKLFDIDDNEVPRRKNEKWS